MDTIASATATVLAVDDDPVCRIALTGVLRRVPGVAVVEAADGQAAWKLLHDGFRPTVCCTDVGMPLLDGLGLMDRIRAHPIVNDLPVILVTGISELDTVLAARERGAAGYIVKPFVKADTVATLQRVVRKALLRHAEAPAATQARLAKDAATLSRLLMRLREQVAVLMATQASAPVSPDGRLHLGSLRTGCMTMGLWRAVELIDTVPAVHASESHVAQVLLEVDRLAADQLGRFRQLGA